MSEERRFAEEDRREISKLTGQTLKLLTSSGLNESPSRYRAVVRNAAVLAEMWARHIRKLNTLPSCAGSIDRHWLNSFDRMMNDNRAVGIQLSLLASSDWPRLPQLGLNSIRTRTVEILGLVLRQLKKEEHLSNTLSLQLHSVPPNATHSAAPLAHESN